jgi:hypothetical protein
VGTNKGQAARNDWSLTPRGSVSATAQAAAALMATSGLGEVAHVHPVYGMAAAGAGALGHLMVGAHRAYTPGAILYRLGCWAGAGGWLTWSLASDAPWWNTNGLASLAVGAVGAAAMVPLAGRTRGGAGTAGANGMLVLRSAARTGQDWDARFRRVCRVNVEVTSIREWSTGAGYDVHGRIPPGGATVKALRTHCDALATDANLPDGCGVEIVSGGSRASFIAHVATVNRLVETIDYPDDFSPTSIMDPKQLGEHRDATPAAVHLRESSAVITGRKGSGKTNLLDVGTCEVGRSRDALVMHIDLNGGGMSQAWLHPWLIGDSDRPAIDWAASTPEEALYLTTAALAVAKARKSSYRTYKIQQNSKLLPLSADLPEWVIFVDESAEVMSPTQSEPTLKAIRDNLLEIQRIGRNEGVNVVFSALRATQDMIPPAAIKQAAVRIGMFVEDPEELAYLLGWRGLDPADLAGTGTGFLSPGDGADPRPFKAFYMSPEQIVAAARAIARQRPECDQASAAAADAPIDVYVGRRRIKARDLYATRYERMHAAFTGEPMPTTRELAEVDTTPTTPTAPPAAPSGPTERPPLRLVNSHDWPDLTGAGPGLNDAAAWPTVGTAPAVTATVDEAADVSDVAELPAAGAVPEFLARILAAFDEADDDRMHSETLAAALGIDSVHELAELLRPYGIQSRDKFKRNGENRRGYWRSDITAPAPATAAR